MNIVINLFVINLFVTATDAHSASPSQRTAVGESDGDDDIQTVNAGASDSG